MLALFAIVQYNDPDALLWFLIYAIPAAWAGASRFARTCCRRTGRRSWLSSCASPRRSPAVYMWPSLPENWIHIEEEREGLGLIIVTAA